MKSRCIYSQKTKIGNIPHDVIPFYIIYALPGIIIYDIFYPPLLSCLYAMTSFVRYTKLILPYVVFIFIICLVYSLYMALIASPADYKQGEFVRIMYIHVPSAWISLGSYTLIAILSFAVLIWQNTIAAIISHAIAPLGLVFTAICLITGSIWGKCTWGTWWVWDARPQHQC